MTKGDRSLERDHSYRRSTLRPQEKWYEVSAVGSIPVPTWPSGFFMTLPRSVSPLRSSRRSSERKRGLPIVGKRRRRTPRPNWEEEEHVITTCRIASSQDNRAWITTRRMLTGSQEKSVASLGETRNETETWETADSVGSFSHFPSFVPSFDGRADIYAYRARIYAEGPNGRADSSSPR